MVVRNIVLARLHTEPYGKILLPKYLSYYAVSKIETLANTGLRFRE